MEPLQPANLLPYQSSVDPVEQSPEDEIFHPLHGVVETEEEADTTTEDSLSSSFPLLTSEKSGSVTSTLELPASRASNHSVCDWVPVGFVFVLLAFSYFVFVFLVCLPIWKDYSIWWALPYLVIYHILQFFVVVSYLQTVLTTSHVPQDFHHSIPDVSILASIERKARSGQLRECKKCCRAKPDRAHHCSKCDVCILKMDHHCPWVNNCVGWKNYKFFLLFIFYVVVSIFFGITATVPFVVLTFEVKFDWKMISIITAILVDGAMCLTLLSFVAMHISFVFKNVTTIESLEKNYGRSEKGAHRKSPYDVGVCKNWSQVFGSNPLQWLLPFHTSQGDGCSFPTAEAESRSENI